VFVAVLVAVALHPVRSFLTEPREVVASTPSDYTGETVPLPLPGRGSVCANEIVFDPSSRIARFGATVPASAKAPALEVVARGYEDGPYRNGYRATARVPGGWRGARQLDVALRPPPTAVYGTFCVRNLENRPVDLVGSEDGRAYSRPSVTVNGAATPTELQLRLLEPGHRSLLSRAGEVMEHAATLRPFGAWWWWLLAAAVVTLAPLGVLLAMRSALAADAAAGQLARAPIAEWPSERLRLRAGAIPGWAIVAAAGAVAVVWFLYWGINTHVFQNDEDQYVYLSRWLTETFPQSLWNFDVYGRGLQRLEVWLLALPAALFDSPWSLIGGRFLNTLAFVSTAIPVYLLGRGMGLRSQWAALPAVVSVMVPWAVVTTGFLTENVAYPACLWAVWAIWRAAAAPSRWRDAIALALLLVAGAARSGLLLLAPVLPVVLLATGLRCGHGRLPARLLAVLRAHIVVWVAVALALLVLLAGAAGVAGADGLTRRLAGGYVTNVGFEPLDLLARLGRHISRAVVGTGFFPAALALPWLAIAIVRAREPARFAFAATVLLAAAAILYSLNTAGFDERYVLYLAPLLLLPATLAIAHREVAPAGFAITSVLLAVLLLRVPWTADQGPFGFFVAPVEMFYSRVVGLRMSLYLPGDADAALTIAAVALAAAGIALAVILRRAPSRLAGLPAVVLVAMVVGVVAVQNNYVMTKYVNGAGSKAGADLRERAFVDRAVPAGATVGEFAGGVGQRPEYFPIWQEVQFYNQRIDSVFAVDENVNQVPTGDDLNVISYDRRTGRLLSRDPLPDYLVIPTLIGGPRPRGEPVMLPEHVPVGVIRTSKPAGLAWDATGFEVDGTLPAGRTATVRFYGSGLRPGPHCATFDLFAPPDRAAKWNVRRAGRSVGAGTTAPAGQSRVAVELPRLVERGFIDIRLRSDGHRLLYLYVDQFC
jgi:hypothetical protein